MFKSISFVRFALRIVLAMGLVVAALPAAGPALASRDGAAAAAKATPDPDMRLAARFGAKSRGLDADSPFNRRVVRVQSPHPAGTIIIDTQRRFLYLLQDDGTAIRYGIGVGREGFSWSGTNTISRKAEWPGWTPPAEMRQRQPYLPVHMPGGPDNPLGARALYLGSTLYRIHGTNEDYTIGMAVSSGCIRMRNEDVVDLYDRVAVGTKVIVF